MQMPIPLQRKHLQVLDLSVMKTILEEHNFEMTEALVSKLKTVEKKVLKELECRKLLFPRIIESDLIEALTDSDEIDDEDPNREGSTKHMKLNANLPKTGKKKTNRHASSISTGQKTQGEEFHFSTGH